MNFGYTFDRNAVGVEGVGIFVWMRNTGGEGDKERYGKIGKVIELRKGGGGR